MTARPKILFTSLLSDKQKLFAESKGLDIEMVQLVETVSINDVSQTQLILSLSSKNILAIFTSNASLNIVAKIVDCQHSNWKIASISPITKKNAVMIFGKNKVIAEGVTSHELAQNIIKLPMEFEKIVFFSGSRRKDDLPGIIKSRYPDKWMEIKVYATKSKPIELKNSYEGIAFCSPSAVDALLEKNNFTDGTKIFAIGLSTANLLSAKGIKEMIISSVPDKNKMLEDIVNYFK